jgi:tRNA (cmo5U34)-methyltransferase
MKQQQTMWDEAASATFIDYGRYFVPDREVQMHTICELLPTTKDPFVVMELAHGEGLLAEMILERFPQATVHGYDISAEMRQTAVKKLTRFGDRFQTHYFDLPAQTWRSPDFRPQAVVTSLTVHHLDGAGKQRLFADMYRILAADGTLIIADLIEPVSALGNKVAATSWDTAVKERAQQLVGTENVFAEFEKLEWNLFRYPDPEVDKPSPLLAQLKWIEQAGFTAVDVYWLRAGHAIFGGYKQ